MDRKTNGERNREQTGVGVECFGSAFEAMGINSKTESMGVRVAHSSGIIMPDRRFPLCTLLGGLGRFYGRSASQNHQRDYACESSARTTHGDPIQHLPCGEKQKTRRSAKLDGLVNRCFNNES
jgi:hypothetical protein